MTPGTNDWIFAAVMFLLVGPVWALALRAMWRDAEYWREPPPTWIAGRAQWFGTIRAALSGYIAFMAMAAFVPVLAVLPDGSGAETTASAMFGVVAVVSVTLTLTTAFLGRPRSLVPPPRRADRLRSRPRADRH
jgi:hypothetical protein